MSNIDYRKLRGRIVEICGSQAKFSKIIGLSEQSITAKLAGRMSFTANDVYVWCNALHIDQNDIGEYFFAPLLQQRRSENTTE